MIDAQLEEKIRSSGFTDKNIAALRNVLNKPENKGRTLHSLLIELKRRFYGAWVIVIALLAFWAYATLTSDNGNGLIYFVVILFFCIFTLGMAPLPLAWKAVKFLRKEG